MSMRHSICIADSDSRSILQRNSMLLNIDADFRICTHCKHLHMSGHGEVTDGSKKYFSNNVETTNPHIYAFMYIF